jgi:hypothetical protein
MLMEVPRRVSDAVIGAGAGGTAGSAFGPLGSAVGAVGGAVAPGLTGRAIMSGPAQRYFKRRSRPFSVPAAGGAALSAAGAELAQSPEEVLDNPSGIPVR